MATQEVNWEEAGNKFAHEWEPGKKLPEFPSEQAKKDFTEGYATGWWERGNDDAKAGRNRMTSFPSKTAGCNYVDGYSDAAEEFNDDDF